MSKEVGRTNRLKCASCGSSDSLFVEDDTESVIVDKEELEEIKALY